MSHQEALFQLVFELGQRVITDPTESLRRSVRPPTA